MGSDKLIPQELLDAIDNAPEIPDDEDNYRTMAGAALATRPCRRHCSVCDGIDHHWLPECDDIGPLMVCKHCEAWREYTDEDDVL